MKKKNLIVIALASTALAIGGGVALASSMSSTKAVEVEAEGNYTFGFVNTDAWDNVYAYVWKNGGPTGTAWPGDKITNKADFKIDGKDVHTVTINTGTYDRLIFNNGSGTQTGNLEIGNRPDHSIFIYNSGMVSPHSWGLCGKLNGSNNWIEDIETGNSVAWTQTNATITVDLLEGDAFKLRADSAWNLALGGDEISGQNSAYFTTASDGLGGKNTIVKAGKSGTYTFEINWRAETYGNKSYAVSVTNYVPKYMMRGNGSLWTGDFVVSEGLEMSKGSGSEYAIENVTLAAGDKFKFTGDGTWWGFSNIKTDSPFYDSFEPEGDNNIVVKAGKGGVFTFYVDTSVNPNADTSSDPNANKAIWVTNEDHKNIDGWAADFIDWDMDFCDVGDTDWNSFATRFAALSGGAQSIFNQADASWSGNNIAIAAARYDRCVRDYGKTPFAGGKRASAAHILAPVDNTMGGVTTAIAVTAAIGVGAAVGMVFIRRRRVL